MALKYEDNVLRLNRSEKIRRLSSSVIPARESSNRAGKIGARWLHPDLSRRTPIFPAGIQVEPRCIVCGSRDIAKDL